MKTEVWNNLSMPHNRSTTQKQNETHVSRKTACEVDIAASESVCFCLFLIFFEDSKSFGRALMLVETSALWKPRWIKSLVCFFACTWWISQIHIHALLGMLNYFSFLISRLPKNVSLKLTSYFDEMIGRMFLGQKETGSSWIHSSGSTSGYTILFLKS